tara:strand:- start:44 stop:346 length:303 start_codon:yes stop_codon:yes gene_type:complete
MALTETKEYDKMEIVGQFKIVQVREATVVKKDGVEISRKFHRFALPPGSIDTSDNWTDTDISGAPDEVKAICAAVWTDAVKTAFKQHLINNKFPRDPNLT